jgi:hypothetical protein
MRNNRQIRIDLCCSGLLRSASTCQCFGVGPRLQGPVHLKGPIYSKLKCAVWLCKKNCTKNWTECSLAQHRFHIRFVSFFVSSVECLEMMPSWCRQVNWGNCGIPWANCAVLCVQDDLKGQFWGLRHCLSKLRSLLSFSVKYDVTQ